MEKPRIQLQGNPQGSGQFLHHRAKARAAPIQLLQPSHAGRIISRPASRNLRNVQPCQLGAFRKQQPAIPLDGRGAAQQFDARRGSSGGHNGEETLSDSSRHRRCPDQNVCRASCLKVNGGCPGTQFIDKRVCKLYNFANEPK
jgi:hypothetical protein